MASFRALNMPRGLVGSIGVRQSASRTYHASALRSALKESDRHVEGVSDEIEQHKHEQLQHQKEGKAQWKDELASDSESAVKADRHEHPGGPEKDIEALQRQAKYESEREKSEGKR